MDHHEALIDRLTRRLRVDPELRMDVANELRAHLEDAAGEFRAAGYTEDAAEAEAVKALGDEADLAAQLWQANRRRIRIRRVCKWAARATLAPGAIAVILLVAWSLLQPIQHLIDFTGLQRPQLSEHHLRRMSEEQRLIVLGDTDAADDVAGQKAIVERWPEHSAYLAHYIAAYVSANRNSLPNAAYLSDSDRPEDQANESWNLPGGTDAEGAEEEAQDWQALLAAMLAELDWAADRDPKNALYPMIKSMLSVYVSGKDLFYSVHADDVPSEPPYIRIHDQAMVDRAVAELRLAVSRPHYSTHQADVARIRLDALPSPRRLVESAEIRFFLEGQFYNWFWLGGTERAWVRRMAAYAVQLAADGRGDEALTLNADLQLMAAKRGAGSQTWIELLVAVAIDALALQNEADIHRQLGRHERAELLELRNEREQEKVVSLYRAPFEQQAQAGPRLAYLHHRLMGASAPVDPGPQRAAEHALLEQAALVGLLVCVLAPGLAATLATGLSLARTRRRRDGPKLLFVGWERIGRICLWAIVLPLLLYVAYTRLAPWSPQRFGIWYVGDRLAMEFVVVGAGILVLLLSLTYRAIRARAAEAGLETPAPLRWRRRKVFATLGLLTVAAVVAYLVAWELGYLKPLMDSPIFPYMEWESPGYGWFIAAAIGLVVLAWLVREAVFIVRLRGPLAHFRRTLIRSSIGVLAAAVIVVGLFCGLALRRAETVHVGRITGDAFYSIHNELELSHFRELRALYEQRHRELLAERTADESR